jgi:hypothetical protein
MKPATNIQEGKRQIIESLAGINDEPLILAIQNMIAYAKLRDEEYFAESIEEYNQKIDEAVAEMNEGKFLEHEEAIKKISKWRKIEG